MNYIGGLRKIPAKELDPNVQVLVINNSKNPLTLSPIFISFKRLQVLQINDVHIQAIGVHTFWGVQNLRVLGEQWACVGVLCSSHIPSQSTFIIPLKFQLLSST